MCIRDRVSTQSTGKHREGNMARFAVVLLALVLLVSICSAKHHHKGKEEKPHKCEFVNVNGTRYDIHLMDTKSDHTYISSQGLEIYFRTCGYVQHDGCDKHSSVCVIDSSNGKAVNFGTYKKIQFTEGSEAIGSNVEGAYGYGETCSNGVPRKTVVQFTCNLAAKQALITGVDYTDCFLQLHVQSAHACPTAAFCAAITDKTNCKKQDDVCQWDSKTKTCGVCEHGYGELHHFLHKHHADVLLPILLVTFLLIVLAFTCCLCVCIRKKRAAKARSSVNKPAKGRKISKKSNKGSVDYHSVPALQLVPGGFVPVDPYSHQGFPMVQLVAPTQQPESYV
eukprot:TRINITY_DN461_c0_g1_i1.p1 TRINITY_DN461_c0_g1~~TRINITY_DN461_c0_g1_i1.p1  ORF type:complete len:337 (-),score=63.35 TRINITY_DN461_c0_g1_i1:65-1075(-)